MVEDMKLAKTFMLRLCAAGRPVLCLTHIHVGTTTVGRSTCYVMTPLVMVAIGIVLLFRESRKSLHLSLGRLLTD